MVTALQHVSHVWHQGGVALGVDVDKEVRRFQQFQARGAALGFGNEIAVRLKTRMRQYVEQSVESVEGFLVAALVKQRPTTWRNRQAGCIGSATSLASTQSRAAPACQRSSSASPSFSKRASPSLPCRMPQAAAGNRQRQTTMTTRCRKGSGQYEAAFAVFSPVFTNH